MKKITELLLKKEKKMKVTLTNCITNDETIEFEMNMSRTIQFLKVSYNFCEVNL